MIRVRECRLPDGRIFEVGEDAADRILCGVVVMQDVRVDGSEGAAEETAALAPGLRDRYRGLQPSEIPALAPARALYKAFGMDPSRHRPSSEALLRRVLKGDDLYRINSAVDSCNLASLSFVLPIGMYDLDRVKGDVVLRVGADGESYPGIRKGPVNLGGRIGLFDAQGPFGSPTSDSARTSVGEDTRAVLAVIMADGGFDPAAMAAHTDRFGEVFAVHCGARPVFSAVLPRGGTP
ncbi:hypothetical protein KJ682_00365 [bacterium]|nr:hypothetical protein [bacterium]